MPHLEATRVRSVQNCTDLRCGSAHNQHKLRPRCLDGLFWALSPTAPSASVQQGRSTDIDEKTHGCGRFDLQRLLKGVRILNDSRRLSFVTDRDYGQGEQSVMNGRNAGPCAFVTQVTDESRSVTYAHCDSQEQDGSGCESRAGFHSGEGPGPGVPRDGRVCHQVLTPKGFPDTSYMRPIATPD
jgi:hypothetical protein